MELKDWVATLLTVWSNVIATIALILTIREKKTAKRKPRKHKRKR